MEIFAELLSKIEQPEHRTRTEAVLQWVNKEFPELESVIKWNQPMFTDHGTYIIGFSLAKHHLAVAPEQAGMNQFIEEINQAGYSHTKELVRIKWTQPIDYTLLKKMIVYNIQDKADCQKFWR